MCSHHVEKTNCPPIFFSTGETASGVLSPVLGSPVGEKRSGVSAVEATKVAGAQGPCKRAVGAGAVQFQDQKAKG